MTVAAASLTHPCAIEAGGETPLPRRPVFGWKSLGAGRVPSTPLPSVADLPHLMTTSGRAALLLALRQLALPPGAAVLVPAYHCPTMVAPVVHAGLIPVFFDIDDMGLPDLGSIVLAQGEQRPRAMIAAHYFGLPQSMAGVAAWCGEHGLALVEDCAHSLYGMAGDRPVGTWGDYAIASLTKFMPVPEAGLLASAHQPLPAAALPRQPMTAQLRGVTDLLELGAQQRRLPGINAGVDAVFRLKRRLRRADAVPVPAGTNEAPSVEAMVRACDLGRCDAAPLWAARLVRHHLATGRAIMQRRANFDRYASELAGVAGARPLVARRADDAVPYVFPWWVDRPEDAYALLRASGMPVLRWDVRWPGTPAPGGGRPSWSDHVLQLLCHQDLDDAAMARIVTACKSAVRAARG